MRKNGPGHRRALATGAGIALLYVALAVLSGHLSPLARRPLLDGFAPVPQYRWVSRPRTWPRRISAPPAERSACS